VALVDLPEIDFVSGDVSEILNQIVSVYEGLTDRTLYPADPVRLFLHSLAAIIVQQRVLIDLTGKANLLRYAPTDVLDHMGAMIEADRLAAKASTATVRFTLSAPQLAAVRIPAGTRVCTTSDPKVYFATIAVVDISAGSLFGDAAVQCTETGTVGNNYLPGQINVIVDPIGYVASVSNTTTSAGGADTEEDDAYRERIRSAPESFSVAGPEGAYKYWAMTANPSIVDISVTSPAACEVRIVPLLENGDIPGQEILAAVDAICSSKTVRPLTDKVTVAAPTIVNYTLALTYYIHRDHSSDTAPIQVAVNEAVNAYILWQKSKLGRGINPSELVRRVMAAGAYRVTVANPSSASIGKTEVAIATSSTVTYGGIVDD